jgi:hypothetical protein
MHTGTKSGVILAADHRGVGCSAKDEEATARGSRKEQRAGVETIAPKHLNHEKHMNSGSDVANRAGYRERAEEWQKLTRGQI